MVLKQDFERNKPLFTESEIENLALRVNENYYRQFLDLNLENYDYKWKLIYSSILKQLKKSKKKGFIHHIPSKLIQNNYLKALNKYYLLDKYSRSVLRDDKKHKRKNKRKLIDNLIIAILIHEFNFKEFSNLYKNTIRNLNKFKYLNIKKSIHENFKINEFLRYYFLIYRDFDSFFKKIFNSLEIIIILIALNITDRNFTFTKSIYSHAKFYLSNEHKLSIERSSTKRFLPIEEKTLIYKIRTVKIDKIIKKSNKIKTLIFNSRQLGYKFPLLPKPGQFIMIWVPGIDEKPMSISGYDELGNWSITVKEVGDCTQKIHNLKVGDFIGIRGPLGNYFVLPKDTNKDIFLIGGGIGMAPLKCLADELDRYNYSFTIIEGATCNDSLIYQNYFKKYKRNLRKLIICTDDGSLGNKGTASKVFNDYLLKQDKINFTNIVVYTCGPEKMIYEIFQICEKYNIQLQVSLERMMRCGCGLCGLCTIDPLGLLVCKDGPIFDSTILKELEDFGKFKRDITGKKFLIE